MYVPHSLSLIRLVISSCDLDELPRCVSLLVNLRKMVAYNNKLKVVPVWFQELPLLYSLDFDYNQICMWPPLKMPNLKHLLLDNDRLSSLPSVVRGYPLNRYTTSSLLICFLRTHYSSVSASVEINCQLRVTAK